MNLKTEFNPLVILGAWNKHIFSPEWVGKFLFPKKKLEVEFPINVDGSPRISTENLRVFILNNRLNFVLRKDEDNTLEEIQELSLKIADYLPHTPVVAYGANFLFEYPDGFDKLEPLFSLFDSEKLVESGYIIDSDQIRHGLVRDNRKINLTLVKKGDILKFDFNFHFDISNLVEFKEKLKQNELLDLKNIALSILNDVYGIDAGATNV